MHNCEREGTIQWRHNERDGVLNNRRLDCLLNRLFRGRSKKTSKLCVTDLCEGNSPVTGEISTQRASNTENVSIWFPHSRFMQSKLLKVQGRQQDWNQTKPYILNGQRILESNASFEYWSKYCATANTSLVTICNMWKDLATMLLLSRLFRLSSKKSSIKFKHKSLYHSVSVWARILILVSHTV